MARYRDFKQFITTKQKEVESKVNCNISWELLSEGNRRYSNWSQQNYRWSDSDYNHSGFCDVYFRKFFYERARLVHQIFTHCEAEKQLPSDIFEKSLKVVSFGCGPGNDLVGFESFYRNVKAEIVQKCYQTLTKHMYRTPYKKRKLPKRKCKKQRNFKSSHSKERHKRRNKKWAKPLRNYTYTPSHIRLSRKKLQKRKSKRYRKIQARYAQALRTCRSTFRKMNARARYVGYDRSSEWRKYTNALGYPFQQTEINSRSVKAMEPADIAILSYFSDSGYLYGSNNYEFWRSLTDKFKLVLVIDTSYDAENVDAMLSRHGFREVTETFYNQNGKEVYTALYVNHLSIALDQFELCFT